MATVHGRLSPASSASVLTCRLHAPHPSSCPRPTRSIARSVIRTHTLVHSVRTLPCTAYCTPAIADDFHTLPSGLTSAAASSSRPSSPPSPSRLSRRELKDFAWIYGTAGLQKDFPAGKPKCPNAKTSSSSSSCTRGSAQDTPSVLQHDAPAFQKTEGSLVTLSQFIKTCFMDAQSTCSAQMSRLGKDPDAEVVHDLRVVLRRLRNLLHLFDPFLDVTNDLEPKNVSRLLRALGAVRDSGAMAETLAKVEKRLDFTSSDVRCRDMVDGHSREDPKTAPLAESSSSQGSLASIFGALRSELRCLEQEQLQVACEELRSKHGRRVFRSLEKWGANPRLKPYLAHHSGKRDHKVATEPKMHQFEATFFNSPLTGLAPALLNPHVSSLLLHPAWHLEDIWEGRMPQKSSHQVAEITGTGVMALHNSTSGLQLPSPHHSSASSRDEIHQPDAQLCEVAHDLRKHLRELRYAMELLEPAYSSGDHEGGAQTLGKHYKEALSRVKELQGILGDLQDLQVLDGFLQHYKKQISHMKSRGQGKTKRGGRRGKSSPHAAALGEGKHDAVQSALSDIEQMILRMQEEVWDQWLGARCSVSSSKGRYKLSKAILQKQKEKGAVVVPVAENAESGLPGLQLDPAEGTVVPRDGDGSFFTSPGSESEPLRSLSSAGNICRLWSSRPPVAAEWEDSEVLPENMLPKPLAEIARRDVDSATLHNPLSHELLLSHLYQQHKQAESPAALDDRVKRKGSGGEGSRL